MGGRTRSGGRAGGWAGGGVEAVSARLGGSIKATPCDEFPACIYRSFRPHSTVGLTHHRLPAPRGMWVGAAAAQRYLMGAENSGSAAAGKRAM